MKKGFLKPLRYISQIFDGREHELQIGFPTDVKHVAHIGWDGPNMNAPGWMKDFHSAPLGTIGPDGNTISTPWSSQEFKINAAGIEDNPSGEMMPRPSRRLSERTVNDSPNNAPRPRHSRRHRSETTVSADSPNREPPSDGSRRGNRRPRKKDGDSAETVAGGDLPAIPKQSRRRSKGSGSVGSGDTIRESRSKNATTRKPADEGEDERL
ncbi:CRIB domain-containing protein RIC7-like isoform X2 [Phoenix dactylifera]|nr:CRIB domain-containing protein RIC7-like isoform X2 [Phoenix dactylifera]XP_008802173.2 CRIB domain-containing protein RIC7-like isoform X2 [Phoenix dactylifera]